MYGNGQLKELSTLAFLVAVEVAFTIILAQSIQLLAMATALQALRAATSASVSHFIKVDLSTDRNKL